MKYLTDLQKELLWTKVRERDLIYAIESALKAYDVAETYRIVTGDTARSMRRELLAVLKQAANGVTPD